MTQLIHPVYADVTAARYPTLADVTKRLDPDGSPAAIAEIMNEVNPILDDAVFLEANDRTSHKTTVRTGIPQGVWRRFNQGIQPTKSQTAQVTDSIGMLENYAEVDKALADLNGNTKEFRLSEEEAFMEGLSQQMADTLFYGDTAVYPDRFLGLAPRYDVLGTPDNKPTANNYMNQVINNGGTGSALTSIWLIVWGPRTCHMVYPKGSTGGLMHTDLGEVTILDDNGGQFQGYRSHYKWNAGFVVRDWRFIVRVANVAKEGLTGELNTNNLIKALNTVPNLRSGKPVIYCNREVKTQLDIIAQDKSNVYLNIDEAFGKPQTNFNGIPVKQCDAILDTETALT